MHVTDKSVACVYGTKAASLKTEGKARFLSALHIVFVTIADLPEGGGNTTRLKMLTTALAACGHEVSVLNEHRLGITPPELLKVSGYMGSVDYRYVLGTVERHFGVRSITDKLAAVGHVGQEIVRQYRQHRIDVLWFNNLSFYDTWPLTTLARRLGIRTIQSYEDERLELLRPSPALAGRLCAVNARLADRYCPGMANAIVVISEYLREKYLRRCAGHRMYLVPTIVDCGYWLLGREPITDVPTLLYAGCFGEQDEMENLLDALALLNARGRRFRAVFLGAHRDLQRVAKVREGVRARGLEHLVEMKGFVPLDQVRSHIAGANILLNIRRDGIWSRSGLSTKLSEYLAAGRAVVCTALGDIPRYLEHDKSAMFVPPTTTASQIAAAIERLLLSPELRQRIGEHGRQAARRHFDIPAVADKLNLMLSSVFNIPTACANRS